ncbi:FeoA family protein [Calothrix sp. UHCC 0171]|uniref:FeoA family protein n=1 Tax=Calothrix sp. UHCC 0171 TaxID=3110245 RepID=UPI002B1EBC4F|nr:FeoA family protein [Calothrix sp. UHCC 0171]MEA5573504.1 FeoA family protein [Calothrix sp. UHCC 0171]
MLIPESDRRGLILTSLQPGDTAFVARFSAETGLEQRLQALGFRTGKSVQLIRKAWFGGPLHVRVGMTEVMVRRRDVIAIHLTQVSQETKS